MKSPVRIIALLATACVAGMLYVALPQMRIEYHKWQVDRLERRLVAAQPAAQTALYPYLDHHQNRLIALGYLFKERHDMPKLKGVYGGPIRLFIRDFNRANPSRTASFSFDHETGTLVILDLVENRVKWGQFVREHNAPEFAAGELAE